MLGDGEQSFKESRVRNVVTIPVYMSVAPPEG